MKHLLCPKYRNSYSQILTPCEEGPSDMCGWVTEHDENSSLLFEKPDLSDEWINECFLSCVTQIDEE